MSGADNLSGISGLEGRPQIKGGFFHEDSHFADSFHSGHLSTWWWSKVEMVVTVTSVRYFLGGLYAAAL